MWQNIHGQQNLKDKTWYRQIMFNRFIDWQQSKRIGLTDSIELSEEYPQQKTLDTILFDEQLQRHLKLALQTLEPKQRAALTLHYYQKYSPEQVAEILGISQSVLQSMFDKIRKQLQRQLAKLLLCPSQKADDFKRKDIFT